LEGARKRGRPRKHVGGGGGAVGPHDDINVNGGLGSSGDLTQHHDPTFDMGHHQGQHVSQQDLMAGVVSQVNQHQQQLDRQAAAAVGSNGGNGGGGGSTGPSGLEGLDELLMSNAMGGAGVGVEGVSGAGDGDGTGGASYEYDEADVDPARTLAAMSGMLQQRQRMDGLDGSEGVF
jgi:hypothetical protein